MITCYYTATGEGNNRNNSYFFFKKEEKLLEPNFSITESFRCLVCRICVRHLFLPPTCPSQRLVRLT